MTVEQMKILVLALVVIAEIIFTMVIKPYIDANVSKEDIEKFESLVKAAVRCAEQIFTPEQWSEKKDYVFNYAKVKASEIGLTLTDEDINIIVEGIVNYIKKG